MVIRQLDEECDSPVSMTDSVRSSLPRVTPGSVAAKISGKLEEGDFTGAVRLASSDDVLAPYDEATFAALQKRHPPPRFSSIPPSPCSETQSNAVVGEEILRAVRSFPKASAGGPDGLRPQHLQDMISDLNCRQLDYFSPPSLLLLSWLWMVMFLPSFALFSSGQI